MSKIIYEKYFSSYPTEQEIAEWSKDHPAAPARVYERELRVEEGDPLYEIDFETRTATRKKGVLHHIRVDRLEQGYRVWAEGFCGGEGDGYMLLLVEENYFSTEKRFEVTSEETLEIRGIYYYGNADHRVKLASYTESADGYRKVSNYVVYKQYRVEFTDGSCTLYTEEVRE